MKTLVIGDTHLMNQIILPMVDVVVRKHKIQRVIMVGDYVDQWGMTNNHHLYLKELEHLKNWKDAKVASGLEVINLVGNHDIPHMIGKPAYYSLQHPQFLDIIGEKLVELGVQVAYQLGDFIVSHAGYALGIDREDWHFQKLSKEDSPKLEALNKQVGKSRGGTLPHGSMVWADFNRDMREFFNPNLPKQIVGHTPVSTVMFTNDAQIIGVDTFTLDRRTLLPLSDGSMLLHHKDKLSVVENPDWKTMETWDKLIKHFNIG